MGHLINIRLIRFTSRRHIRNMNEFVLIHKRGVSDVANVARKAKASKLKPPSFDADEITKISELMKNVLGKDLSIAVVEAVARHHEGEGWRKQIKRVVFNVLNKSNPDFRFKVRNGSIQPIELANMKTVDMASVEMQKERSEIETASTFARMDKETFDAISGNEAPDGVVSCNACGSLKTVFSLVQVNGTERDPTQFCACLICRCRWRID